MGEVIATDAGIAYEKAIRAVESTIGIAKVQKGSSAYKNVFGSKKSLKSNGKKGFTKNIGRGCEEPFGG